MTEQITVGSTVTDHSGITGVVVKIVKGTCDVNCGKILVWNADAYENAPNKCGEFPHYNWEKRLTVGVTEQNELLPIGTKVQQWYGHKYKTRQNGLGVVVKVLVGDDYAHGGVIYVWQAQKTGYGGDNCEHYSVENSSWENYLTVVQ